MNKAVAVLAVWGGVCALAQAQSNTVVYGIADAGVAIERGGVAGSAVKVTSGMEAGSRLGFKGNEDLGQGLGAVYQLEMGINIDAGSLGQGGLVFGRQAFMGLTSPYGNLLFGRQYTPDYLTLGFADPFALGLAGDAKNLGAVTGNSSGRMDNSVKYVMPVLAGVSGELAWAPGEVGSDASAGRQWGAAVGYTAGPLSLRLAEHYRNNNTATLKTAESARNTLLAGVYDLGAYKLNMAWGAAHGLNSSPLRNSANPYGKPATASKDSRSLMLGGSASFGPNTVLFSWTHKDDRSKADQDARQLALGYRYALSKRSDVYLAYAHISNQNGAAYTVGSSIETGTGDGGVNLGLRHQF